MWLNDEACWAAGPTAVWATTLGGYPVLKRWLSYRAAPVLGRDLSADEIQEFTRLVRRLAALPAPALDAAYEAGAHPAKPTPTNYSPHPRVGAGPGPGGGPSAYFCTNSRP